MADPELELGLVFDADGNLNILRSPFFNVGFEDDALLGIIWIELSLCLQASSTSDFQTMIGASIVNHSRHPRHRQPFRGSKPLGLLPSSWHRWVY
ncbi:hypothetical protein MA16_Dca014505 [Dendrobium catenatum]|uniref:Uncharacterized protein n=1 Tax=Dendrobium catenatum TaxID=906689 RepID=A0A2I0VML8_9ASPA|nr:hypothetical protein MA16_Dca014505 [Dendrobium catenatum]